MRPSGKQLIQFLQSKFIQSKSPFEPHPNVTQLAAQIWHFFPDTHMDSNFFHFAYIYLYKPSAWILYTNCIHNFYDVHFLQVRIDVYKIQTIQNVCIQNVSNVSTKFCIHFVYETYTKVCQNVVYISVYILYTFFIHQLYTFCCTIFQRGSLSF